MSVQSPSQVATCEHILCMQEGNLLTGSIPLMAGLQSLSYFSASFNTNLSGDIPSDWLVPSLLGAAALQGLAVLSGCTDGLQTCMPLRLLPASQVSKLIGSHRVPLQLTSPWHNCRAVEMCQLQLIRDLASPPCCQIESIQWQVLGFHRQRVCEYSCSRVQHKLPAPAVSCAELS